MLGEIHVSEGKYSEPFYTKEDKSIVANDWDEEMKPLRRRRGLSWFNRVGPLVLDLYLNMNAFSRIYYPEYSVHDLCREFECLTATLRIHRGGIKPNQHNERYMKEARLIKEKAYIPIEGDLEIDQVIAGYERYFDDIASINYPGHFVEFEDFVLVCGWTKRKEKVRYALDVVYKILTSNDIWYSLFCMENGQYVEGGFDKWFQKLEKLAWDGDKLNSIFESELKKHKLERIPERRILF